MLRVNVLMPTYEPQPAHLREAVESVLAQSEPDWTLLIHDDASTRNVLEIIEPFLHDKRITFVRSPQRLGIGGNWNACVRRTHAPVVQFLFQDDVWTPHALELGLQALDRHESVGMVSLSHRYQFEGQPASEGPYAELNAAMRELSSGLFPGTEFLRQWIDMGLRPNLVGEPSFVMARRSTLERAGPFSETMPQFLDADMWMRCLLHGDWFRVTEDCGFFRVHPKAASARNEESGAGLADRLEAFERLINELPRGTLRREAMTARRTALDGMVKKFLARMHSGKSVGSAAKNGSMKRFALRHPLLMARSLLRALAG